MRKIAGFVLLPYATLVHSLASSACFGRLFVIRDYSCGISLWRFRRSSPRFTASVRRSSPNGFTLLSFAVTLAFAMISWHLIDPSIRLLKRITR